MPSSLAEYLVRRGGFGETHNLHTGEENFTAVSSTVVHGHASRSLRSTVNDGSAKLVAFGGGGLQCLDDIWKHLIAVVVGEE